MKVTSSIPVIDANGQLIATETVHVDTEDRDQIQIWDWIGKKAGALKWTPQLVLQNFIDGREANRTILIQYEMPNTVIPTFLVGNLLGVDAAESLDKPELTVVDMGQQIGRIIDLASLGKYVDPDITAPVLLDWQVPGSPIGPPFEDPKKQLFVWKHTGQFVGDVFTGASGTKYTLIQFNTSPFSTVVAWKVVP